MHNDDPKTWLLIKKGDQAATSKNILKSDRSVKSGKKVDEVTGSTAVPKLDDCPKHAKPWHVKPMLCTLVDEPFSDPNWIYEIKWDGFRAIASKHQDAVELYSRNQIDFRGRYPAVTEAMHKLKHDVILDGEIVVLDSEGQPHFEMLQNYRTNPAGHLHYYAFDILWYDGRDVRQLPLLERKKLLQHAVGKNDTIRYGDYVAKDGLKLFQQMRRRALEGIVAKKSTSPYQENVRARNWLKIKTHLRQEVVIGGYTEPRGSRQYIGSLLAGVYADGKLVYVGHTGGGIPDNQRKQLLEKLQKLERKTPPFSTEPKPNAPVHWVRPELVCEMSFTEWTSDGHMRHPAFEGLRSDKNPHDVHREKSKKS